MSHQTGGNKCGIICKWMEKTWLSVLSVCKESLWLHFGLVPLSKWSSRSVHFVVLCYCVFLFFPDTAPPRFCGTYRHNITSWCVLKSELLFLAFAWFEHLLYVQCECCAWSSMTSFLTPTFLFTVFQQGPMCIASQAGHFRVMVGAIKFFCFFLVVFFFFLQMLFIGQIVQHYSLIGPVINVNVLVRDYSSILVYKCSLVLSWLTGIALSSEVVSVARWERKLNTACSDVGGKADIRNTRCLRILPLKFSLVPVSLYL